MRSLLFNAIVAGALVYLFAGGEVGGRDSWKRDAEQLLARTKDAAANLIDGHSEGMAEREQANALRSDPGTSVPRVADPHAVVERAATAPRTLPEDIPTVDSDPTGIAAPVISSRAASIDASAQIDHPRPPAPKTMPPAQTASANETQPETEATADEAPMFMTPRERRRELHRLARDMESYFVAGNR